ncbi:PREDICTED: G patch domain and ankyrin repeat-containing protein 1 homolog [Dufourea novaeangliae]|nr:PREDICTED: G patch domain and ankyrin repeat-containing protein 1 homolog [Dufourea novaeangliae]
MSAAYCGHLDIIEFLLSLGANKETREKSGLTAAQLALKKNYLNIVALLKKKTANIGDNIQVQSNQDTGFYCEICKISFHQTTWKKHETSTLHIFNTKPKLPNAMYGISRQNKGYQILLNSGWDDQAGLGPSGKGIKYPIKTCLKTDRKGLEVLLQMKFDQQKALKHIQQVEEKASEILTDRQEIVALDKRRNDDRVGMRALQKEKCNKTWVTVGPLLLKLPSKSVEELLMKDQKECDIEINKLRSDLKVKVNELRDLELNPPVPGLMLQPMSHKEMSAIKQTLGQNS